MAIDYASLTVLVIDDQKFVRDIVGRMLGQLGIVSVSTANDGASGLDAVKAVAPDLVVCDIEMTPVDGLAFLETLRKDQASPFANVPVIFLTSHMDSDKVMKARELGVDEFVIKPVAVAKFKERIDRALTRRGIGLVKDDDD